MFEEITIKQVLDKEGYFSYLELHQGDNVIKLSLANPMMDVQKATYKWQNLKDIIDNMNLAAQPSWGLEEPAKSVDNPLL